MDISIFMVVILFSVIKRSMKWSAKLIPPPYRSDQANTGPRYQGARLVLHSIGKLVPVWDH